MQDRVVIESSKRITQNFSSNHLAVDISWRNNKNENIVKAHSVGVISEIVDGKDLNRGSSGLESYGNYIV